MQWNPAIWFSDARQFLLEVRAEFRKVTWPAQKETVGGTVGVIVVVAVITAALSLVDVILGQALQLIVP
jgi:preprotein translocase subunit SecE